MVEAAAVAAPRPEACAPVMPETAEPVLAVRHLDFYYGQSLALADINMEIARNRVTALIGPSGCEIGRAHV
jgi:ABC-type phosphate transport system ATPase subunit